MQKKETGEYWDAQRPLKNSSMNPGGPEELTETK